VHLKVKLCCGKLLKGKKQVGTWFAFFLFEYGLAITGV
jgi:hypothetical protein